MSGFPQLQEKDVWTQFSSFIPMQNKYRGLEPDLSTHRADSTAQHFVYISVYCVCGNTDVQDPGGWCKARENLSDECDFLGEIHMQGVLLQWLDLQLALWWSPQLLHMQLSVFSNKDFPKNLSRKKNPQQTIF